MTQSEMTWYTREMRRRPLMISTSVSNPNERKRPSRRGRARGAPRSRKQPEPEGQEYEVIIFFNLFSYKSFKTDLINLLLFKEPPEIASPQQSDSDSSVRLSLSGISGSNTTQSEDNSDDSSRYLFARFCSILFFLKLIYFVLFTAQVRLNIQIGLQTIQEFL